MKQTNKEHFSFGEIANPIMELLSMALLKSLNLLSEFLCLISSYLISRYTWSKEIKKINKKDVYKNVSTERDDSIAISITNRKEIQLNDINKSTHTAIIGASGSGKSVLIDSLIYEDLKSGKPIFFIDPKGDNESLNNFINLCKLTGRNFKVFSEYWEDEGACSINPVKDGSATNIADRIHHAFTWSEEHYAQICYDALEEAIRELQDSDELVDLESILNKLTQFTNKKESSTFYELKDIQGVISRIRKLVNSDFGKKLNGHDACSISDIRQSGCCIYVGLSVLGYAEIARSLGKIILGDLAYNVYDTYKKITPSFKSELSTIGIYIDELSAVITDEFVEILNKCRGAKMELNFAFQSPSDISKINEDLCFQILENSSNWFIFKQRVAGASDFFSKAMGTIESKKETVRVDDGEELGQGSMRKVEELIGHPNIIRNLNVGQCILLRHYPTRIDLVKVKYLDPMVVKNNVDILIKEGFIEENKVNKRNDKEELIEKSNALHFWRN